MIKLKRDQPDSQPSLFEKPASIEQAFQRVDEEWLKVNLGDLDFVSVADIIRGKTRLLVALTADDKRIFLVTTEADAVSVRKKHPHSHVINLTKLLWLFDTETQGVSSPMVNAVAEVFSVFSSAKII